MGAGVAFQVRSDAVSSVVLISLTYADVLELRTCSLDPLVHTEALTEVISCVLNVEGCVCR